MKALGDQPAQRAQAFEQRRPLGAKRFLVFGARRLARGLRLAARGRSSNRPRRTGPSCWQSVRPASVIARQREALLVADLEYPG